MYIDKSRNDEKTEAYIMVCCIVFFVLFIILVVTILPILALSYAGYYKNEISCYSQQQTIITPPPSLKNNTTKLTQMPKISETPIQIQTTSSSVTNLAETIGIICWMNIYGIFGIIHPIVICFFAWFKTKLESNFFAIMYMLCVILMNLITLFNFCWLIVGSFMFWRDCPNLSPKPMNDIFYSILIIGYITNISAFFSWLYNKNK